MNEIRMAGAALLISLCLNTAAGAATFFGGTGGLKATATFETDITGRNLLVTLTNTGSKDVLSSDEVLTGLYFDISGDPSMKMRSAVVPVGSGIQNGTLSEDRSVGGEWAYASGLTGTPYYGISSVGELGNFNLGEDVGYGITTKKDDPNTYADVPLIKNSAVFMFSGLAVGTYTVSNVTFQYGDPMFFESKLSDSGPATFQIIPEPATLVLLGSGLIGLGGLVRRRRGETSLAESVS